MPSSSSNDEDEDFPGFPTNGNKNNIQWSNCQRSESIFSVTALSCHECGDDFALASSSTDITTEDDLRRVLKYGMRWHCPSCLNAPQDNSFKKDIADLKMTMKKELYNISTSFESQLTILNNQLNKQPNKSQPLSKKMPRASTTRNDKIHPITSVNLEKQRPGNDRDKSRVTNTKPNRHNLTKPTTATVTHQVIIPPAEDAKFTLQTFADKVKTNLLTVPIQDIKVDKNGRGIITFPDNTTRDDGLSKLSKDFHAVANNRPQRMLLPSLTILDIKTSDYKSTDGAKLLQSISDKNPGIKTLIREGKSFKILFIKEDTRRPGFSTAVVRVDPEIYHLIQSSSYRLFIDFSRCRVHERFFSKQCYNCQKFRHQSMECQLKSQGKQVCRYCSGSHDGRTCPHKSNTSMYKCANCGGNHTSTYRDCPVLKSEVNNIIQHTQGMQNFAKNDIRPYAIIT